ncbi:MAG: PilN domain-containing protein [Acidobacteriota bacterium]|nr:PilN domain-containing protein [Acidobacteriota bacterium]
MQVYAQDEGAGRSTLPIAGILFVLLFSAIGGVYYIWLNNEISRANQKRDQLAKQVEELKKYIDLEKKFRDQKEILQKKEEVMLNLKKNQELPVHFMEELANSLPDDVWFREVTQNGMNVTIKGEARTFEAVVLFYNRIQSRTRWFKNVNYPGAGKQGSTISFSISFDLQNPA